MFDRDTAKEQANRVTATGKAVGFPANLKVYTGGKSTGVEKWLVYARSFETPDQLASVWSYLEDEDQVDLFVEGLK